MWEHKGKGITYIGIAFKVFEDGNDIWPELVVQTYIDDTNLNLSEKNFARLRVVDGEILKKNIRLTL